MVRIRAASKNQLKHSSYILVGKNEALVGAPASFSSASNEYKSIKSASIFGLLPDFFVYISEICYLSLFLSLIKGNIANNVASISTLFVSIPVICTGLSLVVSGLDWNQWEKTPRLHACNLVVMFCWRVFLSLPFKQYSRSLENLLKASPSPTAFFDIYLSGTWNPSGHLGPRSLEYGVVADLLQKHGFIFIVSSLIFILSTTAISLGILFQNAKLRQWSAEATVNLYAALFSAICSVLDSIALFSHVLNANGLAKDDLDFFHRFFWQLPLLYVVSLLFRIVSIPVRELLIWFKLKRVSTEYRNTEDIKSDVSMRVFGGVVQFIVFIACLSLLLDRERHPLGSLKGFIYCAIFERISFLLLTLFVFLKRHRFQIYRRPAAQPYVELQGLNSPQHLNREHHSNPEQDL